MSHDRDGGRAAGSQLRIIEWCHPVESGVSSRGGQCVWNTGSHREGGGTTQRLTGGRISRGIKIVPCHPGRCVVLT